LGRTIVDDAARVNCAQAILGCLKTVEKIRDYQPDNGHADLK
jgi:hypothetical protein